MATVSLAKLGLSKGIGAASRLSGRGGGTSLPGKVLLAMQSDAIARMTAQLTRGSVMISATNGKTTTASLLAGMIRAAGIEYVHNSAGANMPGGIATALLEDTRRGRPRGELGLFEVDEAWAAQLGLAIRPRVVLLGNLFRDQLDRYGELETLADSWKEMLAELPDETRLVVNADDPLLADIGESRPETLFFGLEDQSCAETEPRHAADSKFCRRCGAALAYEAVQIGHLGLYRCPNCDFTRPEPQITVTRVESRGMKGSSITIAAPTGQLSVDLAIPGLYNVYNAVAAVAAATALELPPVAIERGISDARAVFGRVENVEVGGRPVAILLIKNPVGANEVLRTITQEQGCHDLWIALNDKIADGRDISWIWDADFELLAGTTESIVCAGTRAEELALRLAYAGIDRSRLHVESDIAASFDRAAAASAKRGGRLFALPTYTALLELRRELSRRGLAEDYWSKG